MPAFSNLRVCLIVSGQLSVMHLPHLGVSVGGIKVVVELVLAPELDGGGGLASRQHSPQTFPCVRILRMPF